MPDLSIGYDTAGAPEALRRGFIQPSELAKRAALDLEKGVGRASKAVKTAAREQETAAQKAERYTRSQRLVAQIMRQTGASHQTAGRAVRLFGKDLDRAEREAAQYARQMDRAEKEVRQLAAAQRAAAGQTGLASKLTTGLTGSIKSLGLQILAAVGLTALFGRGVRFLASELVDAVSGFMELQDAVVGLRKVTDQLEEPQLQGLVSDLELLASTTVPVAIASLTDLAATAGQIGIQSAEGIRLAAATGAQLAEATDLSGEKAITSLSRILAIQGESINSIDNLGSALVALGNTSRATESEIEPIANEIARSTANFKLGSSTIFGYAAALAEVGAKAEGSGTALADLFNTLLKATSTGKGLEGLAQVAGVSADELKRLAQSDISAAALQFLEGLARFGEQGSIALGKVGLDSQRTAKALLPLAANVERLRDRIALSNKEFGNNSALSKEAAAAFTKLSADLQRVKNAYRLLTTDGVAVLAPALSELLRGVAAALVAWRRFSQELAKVPIVTGLVKTALIVLTEQLKTSLDFWTELPRNIAITLVGLVDQVAGFYEALSRIPGGSAIFRYDETAASLRALEADLIALSLAGPRAGTGLTDAGGASDDLAKVLAGLSDEMQKAIAGLGETEKKVRDVRAELLQQITVQSELVSIVQQTGERVDDVAAALGLMEQGFEGTAEQALALVIQLRHVNEQAAALRAIQETLSKPLGRLPSIVDPQPVDVDVSAGPLGGVDRWEADARRFSEKLKDGMQDAVGVLESGLGAAVEAFGLSLVDSSFDFREAMQQLLPQLGAALGQTIGSQFGELGGQLGGAAGSVVGTLLAGLFQRGADEAVAKLKVVDGQLLSLAETIEGELGPALKGMADNVRQAVNSILAEFGGTLLSGEFGFKIRGEDVVRVYYMGLTAEFESQAEAASFLVAQILANSMIAGLSASVEEALRAGDFESTDELLQSLRFAEGIDAALRSPWEQFVAAASKDARMLLSAAADLGINLQRATLAAVAHAQALIDQAKAAVLSAAGLDAGVQGWKDLQEQIRIASDEGVAELEAQIRAAAEAALAQAEANRLAAESFDLSRDAFDGSRESFEQMLATTSLSQDAIARMGERFDELAAAGVPAEEIVQELTVALEGLDSSTVRQAIERFRSQFLGGLYDQMAQLARQAGNSRLAAEFAARAEEFRFQAMLISARVTIAAAQAEGLLGEARAAALLAQLDNLAALRAALQAAGIRGGGRGRGAAPTSEPTVADADREAEEAARRTAEAARAFAEVLADLESRTAGVTDTARAYADEQARLLELYREGSVPLADYARALEMLAELHLEDIAADWAGAAQSMRQTDLQAATLALRDRAQRAWEEALLAAADNPAAYAAAAQAITEGLEAEMHALGREALGALGSEFVRLRREGTATVREIRYLARHLDEFGLTAQQLARVVRERILPDLLAMAIAEAERVGDTERAIELRQQQADIERRLQLLQISLWQAQLEAAGALDAATRAIIDQLVIDLGRVSASTTAPGTEEGPLRPRFPDERLGGGGGGGGDEAGGSVADTLADLERSLRFDLASPAEQAAIRFQELRDRIMAAVGTEEERQRVLMLAQEQYDRQRLEGVRDALDQLRGEAAGAAGGRQGFRAAQAELQAAVASGDEARIEQAIRSLTQAAGSFDSAASRRAALDLARQEVERLIGPFLAGTGAGVLPNSLGAGLPAGPLGPASPLGLGFGAPAPSAPIVIRTDTGDLGTRLGAIEDRLQRIETPLLAIARSGDRVATNTSGLPEVARHIQRSGP